MPDATQDVVIYCRSMHYTEHFELFLKCVIEKGKAAIAAGRPYIALLEEEVHS